MTSSNPLSQQASTQAYEEICANGKLGKRNMEVLCAIAQTVGCPLTRNELYWWLGGYGKHHNPEGVYGRRISELTKFGYIFVPYLRICSRSGQADSVYTLTGYTGPPPPDAKKPSPTLIQRREAGAALVQLLAVAQANGYPVDENMRFVCAWLKTVGL